MVRTQYAQCSLRCVCTISSCFSIILVIQASLRQFLFAGTVPFSPAGEMATNTGTTETDRSIEWAVNTDCLTSELALSCDGTCAILGSKCDVQRLRNAATKDAVNAAVDADGIFSCETFSEHRIAGVWDGPWVNNGVCGYNSHPYWDASCSMQSACGYARVCPCKGVRYPRPTDSTDESGNEHMTGGPVWPSGSASSYDWEKAVSKLYKVPQRRRGLDEVLRASGLSRPCGSPCIAHCIAGQPRALAHSRGLWKAMRHRLFEKLSESPIIFAVIVASAMLGGGHEGHANFVRTSTGSEPDAKLLPALEYLQVDRALILREACTTGRCLAKHAGFTCNATKLGVRKQYDKKSGLLSQFCDVQVRRFQTCMHLVREYENDHNLSFDWVTRQRPDVYWTKPTGLASELSADHVYLHSWATCGYGGGDWFYMAPRQIADVIARFPDEMTCDHLLHDHILPKPCQDCLGCECFLFAWLFSQDVGIARMPRSHHIPSKYCGAPCPADWTVTNKEVDAR